MKIGKLFGRKEATDTVDKASPNQSQEHKAASASTAPAPRTEAEAIHAARPAPKHVEWASKHDPIMSPSDLDKLDIPKDLSGAKNLIDYHHIGSADHEGNYATICHPQRNHIGVHIQGDDAFDKVFNTSWSYHFFGWGRAFGLYNKAIGVRYYNKEGYLNLVDQKADPEAIKHIKNSFKSGEYSAMALYQLDEKTGKFNKKPTAIAVLHNYGRMLENIREGVNLPSGLSQDEKDGLVEWAKRINSTDQLKNTHACNLILVNPHLKEKFEEKDEMQKLCTLVAESMPAKSRMVFPTSVWGEPEAVSKEKQYSEIDWRHLELLDGSLQLAKHPLTIVRSLDHGHDPIDVDAFEAAHSMHRMLQMHKPEDLKGATAKLKEAYEFNKSALNDYNNSLKTTVKPQSLVQSAAANYQQAV